MPSNSSTHDLQGGRNDAAQIKRDMRLYNLKLKNFRCFSVLDLDLDRYLTVLVSENGQGKTSVLDAIRIALWPFIAGFDLARPAVSDPGNSISISDVRTNRLAKPSGYEMARRLPVEISATGFLDINRDATWTRYRDSEAKGTKTKDYGDTGIIKRFSADLQERIRDLDRPEIDLPMFGYYGTGRLWSQKRLTEKQRGSDDSTNPDFFIRTFGYVNCLDPASSYKHFREWFIWAFLSLREQQIHELEGRDNGHALNAANNRVRAIQKAIDACLKPVTGWHTLEYSVSDKSLILHHDDLGTLDVEQLSDGIRSILAMVGDIAHRCIKLNPHLGIDAVAHTTGVVLIDEIDMHLHPRWQQLVLSQLHHVFQNMQFIVSTHSPQVLSTVPAQCVRLLASVRDPVTGQQTIGLKALPWETHGMASSDVMAQIMDTDPVPDIDIARQLSQYKALIQQDLEDSNQAQELRGILVAQYGTDHPYLLESDRLIRLQQLKRRQAGISKK